MNSAFTTTVTVTGPTDERLLYAPLENVLRLTVCLTRHGEAPKSIDWYAFGDQWNHSKKVYAAIPQGDPYTAAVAIARTLHLLPNQLVAAEK